MKKATVLIFTLFYSLLATAEDELNLSNDGIKIGDKVYVSDNDNVIFLDSCHKINKVSLDDCLKNKELKIDVKHKSDSIVFNISKLNNCTNYLDSRKVFFVGKDSLYIYINDNLKYTIVPEPVFNTPRNKTVMEVDVDGVRILRRDTLIASFVTDAVNTLNSSIDVEWISLNGIFDKKKHRIDIHQGSILSYSNLIVTEDSCKIVLGKDPTEIVVDGGLVFQVAPIAKSSSNNDKSLRWICYAVFATLLIFGFIYWLLHPQNDADNTPKSSCNDNHSATEEIADKEQSVSVSDNEKQTVSFKDFWLNLTEEQQSDAVKYISDVYNLSDVSKLSVEQLAGMLTDEQKLALTKILAGDSYICDAIKRLTVENLIEAISRDQEKQLSDLYGKTKTLTVTVKEKVSVEQMDPSELFNSMSSEQLMTVVSKYPERKLVVPNELWNYIFEQIRNKKDVSNLLLKQIFQNDKLDEKIWDVVEARILKGESDTRELSLAITKKQLCQNDEQILDCVADMFSRVLNEKNETIILPHQWDDLEGKIVDRFSGDLADNLSATKSKLTETEKTLSATEGKLTKTEKTLSATEGKLTETEKVLSSTADKLTETEKTLSATEEQLTEKQNELAALILKWTDSMKLVRDDLIAAPQVIHNGINDFYSGTNEIVLRMIDGILNERRSNVVKTFEKGSLIEINTDTTIDSIKSSVRAILLEDLGGRYPGWIDVLFRLHAYSKLPFLRSELLRSGLNINTINTAAERTKLMMEKVGITPVVPELFKEQYDRGTYDLEPMRTIDRIFPSVSQYAKGGIIADIYRIGYYVTDEERKKPIVSIY